MKFAHLLRLAALCLATVGTASATTLTFDEFVGNATLPNGYGGLNWDNFYYARGEDFYSNSGYENGTVSPQYVAYNGFADPATIYVTSGTFDLGGAYLTGAWNDGLEINVKGYTGAHVLAYNQTYIVNATTPTFTIFNFLGVNEVVFSSSGGVTHPGLDTTGDHFAMDNLIVNEFVSGPPVRNVPDAGATLALLGVAVTGMAALRRKLA